MNKRIIAILSAICITVAMLPAQSVKASGTSGSERDTISATVTRYMDSREIAISTGEFIALEGVAVDGIVQDENTHRNILMEENINISDTTYQIENIKSGDTMVCVELNETVNYERGNATDTADIFHTLTIMYDESGVAKIVSDKYEEDISGFHSCSYVVEEQDDEEYGISLCTADLRSEFVCWAEGQEGYLEKASNEDLDSFTENAGSGNYTKYGKWYGSNPAAWCAIFVSWCANMAEVPTSIIPKYSSCATGMQTFKDRDCFYYSAAYGGSYTPKVGDIFFTGSSATSSSHTGVVVKVTSTQITVVDGNWGDKVSRHPYNLTDSSLIGYASPDF